jgi:hypothetical protein
MVSHFDAGFLEEGDMVLLMSILGAPSRQPIAARQFIPVRTQIPDRQHERRFRRPAGERPAPMRAAQPRRGAA